MRKVFAFVVMCMSVVIISGCDKFFGGDLSLVKNGAMDFDKSLTVGQAIDNYQYSKKTEWGALTTENGKRIVHVTSQIDIDKHPKMSGEMKSFDFQLQFLVNIDKTFHVAWCGVNAEGVDGKKITPEKTVDLNICQHFLILVYKNEPLI